MLGRIDRTTVSYVVALSLIAALAIGTHVLIDAVVKRMEDVAEVVNVSGRQRMFSQRVAFFVQSLGRDLEISNADELEQKLLSSINLMASSHEALLERLNAADSSDSSSVRVVYFEEPHDLDARVRYFLEMARIYLKLPREDRPWSWELVAIQQAAEEPLLASLDAAVKQYQLDSEQRVQDLRRVLVVMLAVMLLALVVEALWIFRPLIRRLVRSNSELASALTEVEDRRSQVSLLLDNSGQGFFSFGSDLKVDPEASRACAVFLGRAPDGEDVASLLFSGQPETANLLRSAMGDVFADPDPFRREMMLSLLPERLDIGDFVLRLECKSVADSKVMVVLTDLTEEVALSERIVEERKHSEMIVAAVVDRHDFFLAIEDLRDFISQTRHAFASAKPDPALLDVVFRRAHTCKGVMSQFGFPALADALHSAEDDLMAARYRLSGVDDDAVARSRIVAEAFSALDLEAIEARFEQDLDVVREALGEEYVDQSSATRISADMTKALADLADRLLKRETLDLTDDAVTELLARTSRLTKVSVAGVLRGYDRLVQQLADRFEKDVEPVSVSGPDIWVDMDRYAAVLRALVHIFRNAVAHGIETPEEREDVGKPLSGRVRCSLSLADGRIRILIADDGGGINVDAMRGKLGADATRDKSDQQVSEMIFEDGISTSETVDEISGRGVGLPALKEAVIRLSGTIRVQTAQGAGTTFLVELPVTSDTIVTQTPPSDED